MFKQKINTKKTKLILDKFKFKTNILKLNQLQRFALDISFMANLQKIWFTENFQKFNFSKKIV